MLLSEHRGEEHIDVKTEYGYNVIKLKNASIRIIDGDCRDAICIKSGFISKPGQLLFHINLWKSLNLHVRCCGSNP
ncbi:hypothetical protein DIC82_06645 [Clostridium beijerinckii]|nr:hypothetical protein DIC82_06645 [Clostridium beijerinckii]